MPSDTPYQEYADQTRALCRASLCCPTWQILVSHAMRGYQAESKLQANQESASLHLLARGPGKVW